MTRRRAEICRILGEEPDPEVIRRAGRIIREGGLVAFPTETVYGLGGDALCADAAQKIYAAKGRPSDNPLIVHIADVERLADVAAVIPESAKKLAAACWPGPLTMVLPKTDRVPDETTGGLATVAVRLPSDAIAQALIREAGGFVAAPSANRSGRPSPTTAAHVAEDLGESIDMILDGGQATIGLESTIVDLSERTPSILRLGYYDQQMLEGILGQIEVDPAIAAGASVARPKAPGMKYRHYAPRARLEIIGGEPEKMCDEIRQKVRAAAEAGLRAGVLCAGEHVDAYREGVVRAVGRQADERTIARHLYEVLRDFDADDVDIIYSETYDQTGLGAAIMDRLRRAAGEQEGSGNG